MPDPHLLWRLLDGTTPTDCAVSERGGEWELIVVYRAKTVFRGQYPSLVAAEEHADVLSRNLLVNGWRRIPVTLPDAATPDSGSAPPPQTRVLLVVVDAASRDQYRHDLERVGFTVETASNAAGALRAVRVLVPDVIVLDAALRDLSAREVLSRLRTDHRTAGVPVAALASKDDALLAATKDFDAVIGESDTDRVTNTVTGLVTARRKISPPA